MFLLSSYIIVFMWKIVTRGQYFYRGELKMTFMSGINQVRSHHHYLPFRPSKLISPNGMFVLVTYPSPFWTIEYIPIVLISLLLLNTSFHVILIIVIKHKNCFFFSFNSTFTSFAPLKLMFYDVWSFPIYSHDGLKHYVIFVDHFTRYIWFYPLKRKSNISDMFIHFKAIIENFFQKPIITLYTNNDGEYIDLKYFLSTNGISHITTPPHIPKHNEFY